MYSVTVSIHNIDFFSLLDNLMARDYNVHN